MVTVGFEISGDANVPENGMVWIVVDITIPLLWSVLREAAK